MIVSSNLTGADYEDRDCVFFRNPIQSAFYVFRGAKLIDLFVDDKMKFVVVFDRKDHEGIKMEWKTRKENIE